MKRGAGLLAMVMILGALGIAGCKKGADDPAEQDGTANAPDSPSTSPAQDGKAASAPAGDQGDRRGSFARRRREMRERRREMREHRRERRGPRGDGDRGRQRHDAESGDSE
jgi:hypothetical protein